MGNRSGQPATSSSPSSDVASQLLLPACGSEREQETRASDRDDETTTAASNREEEAALAKTAPAEAATLAKKHREQETRLAKEHREQEKSDAEGDRVADRCDYVDPDPPRYALSPLVVDPAHPITVDPANPSTYGIPYRGPIHAGDLRPRQIRDFKELLVFLDKSPDPAGTHLYHEITKINNLANAVFKAFQQGSASPKDLLPAALPSAIIAFRSGPYSSPATSSRHQDSNPENSQGLFPQLDRDIQSTGSFVSDSAVRIGLLQQDLTKLAEIHNKYTAEHKQKLDQIRSEIKNYLEREIPSMIYLIEQSILDYRIVIDDVWVEKDRHPDATKSTRDKVLEAPEYKTKSAEANGFMYQFVELIIGLIETVAGSNGELSKLAEEIHKNATAIKSQ